MQATITALQAENQSLRDLSREKHEKLLEFETELYTLRRQLKERDSLVKQRDELIACKDKKIKHLNQKVRRLNRRIEKTKHLVRKILCPNADSRVTVWRDKRRQKNVDAEMNNERILRRDAAMHKDDAQWKEITVEQVKPQVAEKLATEIDEYQRHVLCFFFHLFFSHAYVFCSFVSLICTDAF